MLGLEKKEIKNLVIWAVFMGCILLSIYMTVRYISSEYSVKRMETDSMNPAIKSNDFLLLRKYRKEFLRVNDIIMFKGDYWTDTAHRIIEINTGEDGEKQYVTKGDNNRLQDYGYRTDSDVEYIVLDIINEDAWFWKPLSTLYSGVNVITMLIYANIGIMAALVIILFIMKYHKMIRKAVSERIDIGWKADGDKLITIEIAKEAGEETETTEEVEGVTEGIEVQKSGEPDGELVEQKGGDQDMKRYYGVEEHSFEENTDIREYGGVNTEENSKDDAGIQEYYGANYVREEEATGVNEGAKESKENDD